jgi:hypothetical protein
MVSEYVYRKGELESYPEVEALVAEARDQTNNDEQDAPHHGAQLEARQRRLQGRPDALDGKIERHPYSPDGHTMA